MNAEALALGPGNPENVRAAAYGAIVLGHREQGLSLSRRAVDLDPLNADSWETLAETEYAMGQLDQAEEHAKKALALNPDVWPGASLLSRIYLTKGKPQESLVAIEQVRSERIRLLELALTYHALGRKADSDAALTELSRRYGAVDPFLVATAYGFRNQHDEAFQWLDRSLAVRDTDLSHLRVEPTLQNLRNDPRYAALLKKVNLPN